MHEPHSRLILSLTLRYVLVLVALAVLVTSSFLLLQRQIELNGADSAVINASGRQRMLSQRTALLAQQLAASEDAQKQAELLAELRQAQAIFAVTHQRLMRDEGVAGHGRESSAELRALYFDGPDSLDRRFHGYDALLQSLINTPLQDRAAQRDLVRQIVALGVEGGLLERLDHAVQLYQRHSEAHLRRIDHQQRWILLAVLAALLYSAFGVFRPMVDRIRAELKELSDIKRTLVLRVRERTLEVQRMAQAMAAGAEAILITDVDGIIQYANRACLTLNGYREDELIGQHARMFRGGESAGVELADLWPTIRSGLVWSGDVVNARKDGSRYHAHLTIAPIHGDDGNIDGYVSIQSDITALKQAEERLQSANQELDRLATEDALTGIANRRVFDRDLDEEWGRARRSGQALAMIMIDIDFFKAYNDTFGHQQGDVCLQQVAQCLRQSLSRPGDRVARYGGEEFAVLLPDTNIPGALDVAETIRRNVSRLALPAANTTVSAHVTVSMGVASMIPDRKQPQAELVQAADQALYQAKHSGRDRAVSA